MKTWSKVVMMSALAIGLTAGRSWAGVGTPSKLNIDVTVGASLSVSVNDSGSSTMSVTWSVANASLTAVGLATATVTNDSGFVSERWALSTASTSVNGATVGGSSWTLAGSTASAMGEDQFALQAVFGSSNTAAGGCPSNGSTDWEQPYANPVLSALQTYGTATGAQKLFAATAGDTALTNDGTAQPDNTAASSLRMFGGSKRALCWRILAPASSSTSDFQIVTLTVTAQ